MQIFYNFINHLLSKLTYNILNFTFAKKKTYKYSFNYYLNSRVLIFSLGV